LGRKIETDGNIKGRAVISTEAYQTAIRLLTRREHSALEMHRKLSSRNFEASEIAEAIELLISDDILSDERFSDSYVRSRVDKGFGPLKIRAELRERGVDRDLIGESVDEFNHEWPSKASAARNKRFGDDVPEDWDERAKQTRFLQARGFTQEHILAVLGEEE